MKSIVKLQWLTTILFLPCFLFSAKNSFAQDNRITVDVGVAKADITPQWPIRLTGYGARSRAEATEVLQRLEAKAMAIGSDADKPSILLTVDLVGITDHISSRVKQVLSEKVGIDPAQVVICASHTHGGPEIGSLINICQYREGGYSDSLMSLEQLIHIAEYTEMLTDKLIEISLAALKDRQPCLLDWGQGQAHFAANRRTEGGPVDVALPVLRARHTDGKLKAVFVSYACHGTTLEGINQINADWIGEAKRLIELNHPGCMALVALGCGADADPNPRGSFDDVKHNGQDIAANVDKVLASQMQPLDVAPQGKIKWVKLPFSKMPTVKELIYTAQHMDKRLTLYAYYARLALERIQRGEKLPTEVKLPVQVWNFGSKMLMINLGGEVVVDYSLRLKHELGAERTWINAYSNDVPCYIASRRVIKEGGYEADFSMTCYDKPSPLVEEAEDIIVSAVHELVPSSFNTERPSTNWAETVEAGGDGKLNLYAADAKSSGPNIKYMPEWKAFGWFNTDDQAEWNMNIDNPGKYEVYIDYSVSDDEAGKTFLVESSGKKLKGRILPTGSWYTYARKKIGVLNFPAGTQKLTFKSGAPNEKGAMLDLREVTLVPVAQTQEKGFRSLFNGTDLDEWVGNKIDYVAENGILALRPENKGGGGNLFTKQEFSDFEFRFEFKLTPGANNGIGIRAPLEGDAAYKGMEIQILDDNAEMYKSLHDYQFHGSIYGVMAAKKGFLKPAGQWNSEHIIARGNKIKVVLNGTTILDGDIEKASRNGTPDQEKHPGLENKKGHIGFLWHETPIKFRNIRIKEL